MSIERVANYTFPSDPAGPKEHDLCATLANAFTLEPEITDPMDRAAYIFLTVVYNWVGLQTKGDAFVPGPLRMPETWRTLANACKRYHGTAQAVLWIFPELGTDKDKAEMKARRGDWRLLMALPRVCAVHKEREVLQNWVRELVEEMTRPAPGLIRRLLPFGLGKSASSSTSLLGAADKGSLGMGKATEVAVATGLGLSERPRAESMLALMDEDTVAWFSRKSDHFAYLYKEKNWPELVKLIRSENFTLLVLRPLDAVFANTSLTVADLARLLDAPAEKVAIVPLALWAAGYNMSIHSPRLMPDPNVRARCMPTTISSVFPRAGFDVLVKMHQDYAGGHLYDLWAKWWSQKLPLEGAEDEDGGPGPRRPISAASPGTSGLLQMERAPGIGIPRRALFSIHQLRNLCQLNDASDLLRYVRKWKDFAIISKVLGLQLWPDTVAVASANGKWTQKLPDDNSWIALGLTLTQVLMHPRIGHPRLLTDQQSTEVMEGVIKKVSKKLLKMGFKEDQVRRFCLSPYET